jgi:predicted RNase H-like nuclease (RuvC/YqgF family)
MGLPLPTKRNIFEEVNPLKGLEEFLILFGDMTVSQLVTIIIAGIFLRVVYNKVKQYFDAKIKAENERIKAEKKRDEDIKTALSAIEKYPEYRKQSIKIQELLEGEIQELREEVQELRIMIKDDKDRIQNMEEQERRRECNKLRDTLIQNYRYYTNKERNPSQSWTNMESEAFWDLFRDYEDLGGDGYMHTVVQPDMERLTVIEIGK